MTNFPEFSLIFQQISNGKDTIFPWFGHDFATVSPELNTEH